MNDEQKPDSLIKVDYLNLYMKKVTSWIIELFKKNGITITREQAREMLQLQFRANIAGIQGDVISAILLNATRYSERINPFSIEKKND